MTALSGNRPYAYVGPFPFTASGTKPVGISGILFEQNMFTLTAEADIYTSGFTRTFTKYINKGAGISSTFEPTSSGSNLVRANIHFKDYITTMRTRMSGLFGYIASDSPYSQAELLQDYFRLYLGDNPSGSVANWYHTTSNLGENGKLYDIDVREVQYQPYIRVSKYRENSVSGVFRIPTSPICPMFCSKTGDLVNVTNRDLSNAAQVDEFFLFGYSSASANKFAIFGDIFVKDISKVYLTWGSGSLNTSDTGNCDQTATRIINEDLPSGLGMFSVPSTISVGTGIYGIQVFNNSATISGMFNPPSGTIGFWPPRSTLNVSGYQRATMSDGSNEVFFSGLHIFNTALYTYTTSGVKLDSPINGATLWYRFADNQSWSTSDYGPKRWSDINSSPALPIAGTNQNLVFYIGTTLDLDPDPSIADRRFVFSVYNPSTLDFINAIQESYKIISPASPPSVDRFFFIYGHTPVSGINLSDYYCISEQAGLSSGPEVYILDSSLENVGAWETATDTAKSPVCVINGNLYGYSTTQTSASGETFFWKHLCFADPGGVFPDTPGSASVTDSNVHVYETRDTVYDNTNNIASLFEPLNQDNFTFGGNPFILDPRGTDMDYGDGSVLVRFSAKMKGETVLKSFLGRIVEDTVGGNPVLKIYEATRLKESVPSWVYGIT